MSWFTDLAGKAEELLNKVDQTAGSSLNTSLASDDPELKSADTRVGGFSSTPTTPARDAATAFPSSPGITQVRAASNLGRSSPTPQTAPSAAVSKRSSKKNLDDELFEFLNSEQPANPAKMKLAHSRQSSTGSNRTVDSGLHFTARPQTPADEPSQHSPTDRHSGSSACPSDYEVVDNPPILTPSTEMSSSMVSTQSGNGAAPAQSVGHQEAPHAADLKSLELENGLLKNEVQSLNNELTSLIQRARNAEQELSSMRSRSDSSATQISKLETMMREFRDRETDQAEALKAKDSQVAILRVRLEELEEEVKSKSERLGELEFERKRILQDHTDSSGLTSQALESLKAKLAEAESKLKLDNEHMQRSQTEHSERQIKLENDQQALSETIVQLQKKVADEKHRNETLSQQLKHSKINVDSVKQELTDYKEKATRILQSKDKLITSMRDSGGVGGAGLPSDLSAGINAEMEQEKTMLRQELQQSASTIESLRMEVQDLETQLQADHEESRETIENLEERLHREQNKYKDLEQELSHRDEELKYTQEQNMSQKTSLQQQIHERDVEIEKLRNQLMSKKLSTASESELETRLHHLTENLIQKQTLVESLSTEKNSLKLQLERSEQQCKDMEMAAQRTTSSTTVYMGGDDEGIRQRGHIPGFLKESPTDPEFTRKVKQAANTIDKFSIRLGVFLRRYPIARVFVIVYMLLLHLWTMVVLLTYQPEMHGSEHSHMPVPVQDNLNILPK